MRRSQADAKNSLGDEQWAAVYQEPELQELIRKALDQQLRRAHCGASTFWSSRRRSGSFVRRNSQPSRSAERVSAQRCRLPSAIKSLVRWSMDHSMSRRHGRPISGASTGSQTEAAARSFWRRPGPSEPFV